MILTMFWTLETSATTSPNSLFSMTMSSLDEAADYRIVCTGGSAQSVGATAESVGLMLAPRGASNATPLTTVVALNSELADKIGQSLLSSSSQSYSEGYDVDIAKSGGTYGERLQFVKGIETFMYVLGRTNPDLPIISTTQGYVAALQILADNLNELDSSSLFNASNIATKIGEAATETLGSNSVDSLVSLSAADQAALVTDIQGAATAVMAEVATGTSRKITEESVITACSSAFAASDLVANKTRSTKASSLPPYASFVSIADNTGIVVYSVTAGNCSVDNDMNFDNITVSFAESLSNGQSLIIENLTFTIVHNNGTMVEKYQVNNIIFAQGSAGAFSITINNSLGCDITTNGNSIILGYDNVTASCNAAGSTANFLKTNGKTLRAATFTVEITDSGIADAVLSDNLSETFELNVKE